LIVVARQWAERLDKPVRGWMSEKQDAFVGRRQPIVLMVCSP
jgi:hypothetical protein